MLRSLPQAGVSKRRAARILRDAPIRGLLRMRAVKGSYAIAFFKFSSTLSRKPVVESHF
jgi:hypothetical protein